MLQSSLYKPKALVLKPHHNHIQTAPEQSEIMPAAAHDVLHATVDQEATCRLSRQTITIGYTNAGWVQ